MRHQPPPGGGSFADVCRRVARTVQRLAEAHSGVEVVVVSHGGAMRAAVAHVLDLAPEQALLLSVQNLSVTILKRHEQSWRVVSINELPGFQEGWRP